MNRSHIIIVISPLSEPVTGRMIVTKNIVQEIQASGKKLITFDVVLGQKKKNWRGFDVLTTDSAGLRVADRLDNWNLEELNPNQEVIIKYRIWGTCLRFWRTDETGDLLVRLCESNDAT